MTKTLFFFIIIFCASDSMAAAWNNKEKQPTRRSVPPFPKKPEGIFSGMGDFSGLTRLAATVRGEGSEGSEGSTETLETEKGDTSPVRSAAGASSADIPPAEEVRDTRTLEERCEDRARLRWEKRKIGTYIRAVNSRQENLFQGRGYLYRRKKSPAKHTVPPVLRPSTDLSEKEKIRLGLLPWGWCQTS